MLSKSNKEMSTNAVRNLFSTSQEPKPQVPCFRDDYSYKDSHESGARETAQRLGAITALFKRT